MNASRTSAFSRRALIRAVGAVTVLGGGWAAGCGGTDEREETARELGRLTIGADEDGHTLHGVLVRRARRAGYGVESVEMRVFDAATGQPFLVGGRPLSGRFIRSLPNMGGASGGGYLVERDQGNGNFDAVALAWHLARVARGETYRVMLVPGPLSGAHSSPLYPADQALIEAEDAWARNG